MEENIRCILVEPNKLPKIIETSQKLDNLQKIVDGYIECINIDKDAILICNEEGKIRGLRKNRRVGNDIIVGSFLIVGDDYDNECFKSLSSKQVEKYMKFFDKKSIIKNKENER